MANIVSYVDIIELMTSISQRHFQINTFFLGRDWELENNEDILYPVFQVYPEVAKMPMNDWKEYKTLELTLRCKVIDLTTPGEGNEKDVHSDTLRIAQDIVNEINQHPYYMRSNVSLMDDITFTAVEEFEDDITAGWMFDLKLKIINANTFCGMPIAELDGISADGPTSTGQIVHTQYLTCETLEDCAAFEDHETRITNLEDVVFYQNELISGGASFLSGLTFAVTDLVYIIAGQLYNSLAQNVTIAAGDPTFDRIDVIVVNTAGVVSVVQGLPDANPVKPDIDENTQVEVTFITVPAGATVIPIPITLVYDEFTGPPAEWTTTTNGGANITLNATNLAYNGTKSIRLTNCPTNKVILFNNITPFDTTTQNTLQFAIRNNVAWTTTRRLRFTLQSTAGVQVGNIVDVYQGKYGFSSANTTAWQIISIPISAFAPTTSLIGRIAITTYSTSGTLNLNLDYFRLLVGTPSVGAQNTFLTMKDDAGLMTSATTPNDILTISGGTNLTSAVTAKKVTLNLDPNISLTSAILTSGTANTLAYFNGSKSISSITLGTGLSLVAGTLSATAVTPTIGVNQVAFGNSPSGTLTSNSGFTYNGTNVGIGTATTPDELLEIRGNGSEVKLHVNNTSLTGGYAEIKLTTDISDTRFGAGGTGTTPYGGNAGDAYFGNVSNNGLILATNNTVRGYFRNSGELDLSNTLYSKDIVVASTKYIKGGTGWIDFYNQTGVALTSDSGNYATPYVWTDSSTGLSTRPFAGLFEDGANSKIIQIVQGASTDVVTILGFRGLRVFDDKTLLSHPTYIDIQSAYTGITGDFFSTTATGDANVYAYTGAAGFGYTDGIFGGITGAVNTDNNRTYIQHSTKNEFVAPYHEFTGGNFAVLSGNTNNSFDVTNSVISMAFNGVTNAGGFGFSNGQLGMNHDVKIVYSSALHQFTGLANYTSDYSASYVNRSLVDKEYVDLAIAAATPSISLSAVLAVGNTTGGTDIAITTGDRIVNDVNSAYIDMNKSGNDDLEISSDNRIYTIAPVQQSFQVGNSYLSILPSEVTVQASNGVNASVITTNVITGNYLYSDVKNQLSAPYNEANGNFLAYNVNGTDEAYVEINTDLGAKSQLFIVDSNGTSGLFTNSTQNILQHVNKNSFSGPEHAFENLITLDGLQLTYDGNSEGLINITTGGDYGGIVCGDQKVICNYNTGYIDIFSDNDNKLRVTRDNNMIQMWTPAVNLYGNMTNSVQNWFLNGVSTIGGTIQTNASNGRFIIEAKNTLDLQMLNGTSSLYVTSTSLHVNRSGVEQMKFVGATAVTNNGSNNTIIVTDATSSKGIVYATDYSANFTFESLVSKRYVDSSVSTGGALKVDKTNSVLSTYLEIPEQSAPSTPTNAIRLYTDSSNRFCWKGENGFTRTFDGTANTADRIYVLPDAAGTVALTSDITVTPSSTNTLTNKRLTSRVTTITSSATPTINTDNCDAVTITALATNITSMTSGLTGTPNDFDKLMIRFYGAGAQTIAWGAKFASRGAALPTTTVAAKYLTVGLVWNNVGLVWDCVAVAQEV